MENLSPAQQAHKSAQRAIEASRANESVSVNAINTVEDMLELVESARVARNILAHRYHEIHPDIDDMEPEHMARVAHHINHRKHLGYISSKEWADIGLSHDQDLPTNLSVYEKSDDEGENKKLLKIIKEYDTKKIAALTRPDWDDHFPERTRLSQDDLPEGSPGIAELDDSEIAKIKQEKWNAFKSQYPEDMQVLLEELRWSTIELEEMRKRPELDEAFSKELSKRHDIMLAASAIRALERTAENLESRSRQLLLNMPEGQSHSAIKKRAAELKNEASYFKAEAGKYLSSKETIDECIRRSRLDDRRQLRHGLLRTPEMESVVDTFVPQLLSGHPVLLLGETGGAKTAAAEEMARQVNRQNGNKADDYEFVSGYGQMNSYQLMGSKTIREGNIEFDYGPISRAIIEGKPIILDEVNAMDPDIIKRLNKILQLEPGDTFQIQEDGGERLVVKKGFCVIVTANEKSGRYKGVNEMSADFKNRFGANQARVSYPDLDVKPGQIPKTLMRLASAVLYDESGNIPTDNPAINTEEIARFVKACHRIQRAFCIPPENLDETERSPNPESNTRGASNQTILKMEAISPRLMTSILESLKAGGYTGTTLTSVLERYLAGVTDDLDRSEMRRILVSEKVL